MSFRAVLGLLLATASLAAGQPQRVEESSGIPARPEDLVFNELHFVVPNGNDYQHRLSNGVVVYVAEDHTLPLVRLGIQLREGGYLDPPGKIGLAALTGGLIRTGGTESSSPGDFDEQVEFLAASLSSYGGDAQAGARLSCITPVLDDSLELFFDMLRHPRFDAERLAIEKGNVLEQMRQRNDDADDILGREWGFLLYGKDHYSSRRMTESDLESISRDDIVTFHEAYWRPENMIVTVSGDVDTDGILKTLETYLRDWPGRGADNHWPPPEPTHSPVPGVYYVEKDIPQGKVRIGHLVPQWSDWTNPDRAAIQVMDEILGSSGFTSRIVKRVRSDEGLAYSARSNFSFDPLEPGTFTISFQSKNATVALAAQIALEEVRRMQAEPVSDEELTIAKNSLVETFPRRFESAAQIASIFSTDSFYGRSHDYWQRWRSEVESVTTDDVLRVSKSYLHPDDVVFLIVGKWDEIAPGDPDGRASMKEFFGGEVTHLPLRDPLTLE
jgi:zinc protease